MQNFLSYSANISKLLWGQAGKHTRARADLCGSCGIEDSSPLRSTTMRNHFEHFDERIDECWRDAPRHNISDKSFGPVDRIPPGVQELEVWRNYDPNTGNLRFWGDLYNVHAIAAEARHILDVWAATEPEEPWRP